MQHTQVVPLSVLQREGQATSELNPLLININRLTQRPIPEQHVIIADNVKVANDEQCIVEGNVIFPFTHHRITRINGFINHHEPHKLPKLTNKSALIIPNGRSLIGPVGVILCVLVAVVINRTSKPPIIERTQIVDPYAPMVRVLTETGINVKIKIVQLYEDLNRIKALQHWALASLNGDVSTNVIRLKSIDNRALTEQVKQFARQYQYTFTQDTEGIILIRKVGHIPLMKTPYRMNINGQQRYLEHALMHFFSDSLLNIENAKTVSNGLWNETKLILSFSRMNIDDLDTIGTIINGHPASFESIEIIPLTTDSRYLEGKMVINLIGVIDNG